MTVNPTLLRVRKANEWIREAKARPLPSMLFGEFWYEGELAIMFGDTGSGKSVLAVQIAEAIARGNSIEHGRSIEPLQTDVKPQTVIYLDFDHTAKQFEMRYAFDRDDARGGRLVNHYAFSQRFHRVEVDVNTPVPDDFESFDEYLSASLEQMVRETKVRVLIVDNLTRLKRTCESTRECIAFMRELARLKVRYGLSILVLADMPKRDTSRPIVLNDLQGAKLLANYADSIFAIGQSKSAAGERYIKQIKQRSAEIVYHASHVPVFRIKKLYGNFLGFDHIYFCPEADLLRDVRDQSEWAFIERIRQMHAGGMSIREIAEKLRMSRSAVHRYLSFAGEKPRNEDTQRREEEKASSVHSVSSVVNGFEEHRTTEHTETHELFHEDHDENFESEEDAVNALWAQFEKAPPAEIRNPQSAFRDPHSNYPPFDGDVVHNNQTPYGPYALKRARDAYGREIFVEAEDHQHRPWIWYQKNPQGEVIRYKRATYGVDKEVVNGDFLKSASSGGRSP